MWLSPRNNAASCWWVHEFEAEVVNTNFDDDDFTRYLVLHVGSSLSKEQIDAEGRRCAIDKESGPAGAPAVEGLGHNEPEPARGRLLRSRAGAVLIAAPGAVVPMKCGVSARATAGRGDSVQRSKA